MNARSTTIRGSEQSPRLQTASGPPTQPSMCANISDPGLTILATVNFSPSARPAPAAVVNTRHPLPTTLNLPALAPRYKCQHPPRPFPSKPASLSSLLTPPISNQTHLQWSSTAFTSPASRTAPRSTARQPSRALIQLRRLIAQRRSLFRFSRIPP